MLVPEPPSPPEHMDVEPPQHFHRYQNMHPTPQKPIFIPSYSEDFSNKVVEDPSLTEDVLVGAFFLQHLHPYCENCGASDTPQWRKGWVSSLLGREVLLCNACGLKYHKGQFCPHCKFVYGKEHDRHVRNSWLRCVQCSRWTHGKCEEKACGVSMHQLNHEYFQCVDCRNQVNPSHITQHAQE